MTSRIAAQHTRKGTLLRQIIHNRNWYLFVLPAILFFLLFSYVPLYFVQIAFRNYRITRNVLDCEWVGMKYFIQLFTNTGFKQALRNTVLISLYKVVFGWLAPILLAVLLNEIGSAKFKRVTQTIIYLPHFISWVVIGGILLNMLAINGGVINEIIKFFGGEPVLFLGDKRYFRTILVVSDIWKISGWNTIIYLAALTKINPELYESAVIDGANRVRQIIHITLPGIRDVMVVLLILQVGNLLNAGFEQIISLQNRMVMEVSDVLDTYVYRLGLQEMRYGFATAAGLFKSVVACVMIVLADRIAKQFGEQGLF